MQTPNPFPSPEDIDRASAGPLAALAKKLTEALADGHRKIGIPFGLAAHTAVCMRAAGWIVTEHTCEADPINVVDLVFVRPPTTK